MHTGRRREHLSATRSATGRRPSRRRKKPRKNEAQTNNKKYSAGGCYQSTLKVDGCKISHRKPTRKPRCSRESLLWTFVFFFSSFRCHSRSGISARSLRDSRRVRVNAARMYRCIRYSFFSGPFPVQRTPAIISRCRGINFVRDLWNRPSFPRDWLHKGIHDDATRSRINEKVRDLDDLFYVDTFVKYFIITQIPPRNPQSSVL